MLQMSIQVGAEVMACMFGGLASRQVTLFVFFDPLRSDRLKGVLALDNVGSPGSLPLVRWVYSLLHQPATAVALNTGFGESKTAAVTTDLRVLLRLSVRSLDMGSERVEVFLAGDASACATAWRRSVGLRGKDRGCRLACTPPASCWQS
jgi:hypothetical protein